MNRITEITRRDILDLFQNGIERISWFEEKLFYPYFGRLEELEFLERIYDLTSLPTTDPRFQDAKEDIWQHTINNDDYPFCWVFEDERFQLKEGSDEVYLRFICEIFHPVVRDEKGYWKDFFDEVNKLLQNDGYELYPIRRISNREEYGWRIFESDENKLFIPFSQRNKQAIKDRKIVFSIKRHARKQIYHFLKKNDNVYQITDETGWNYNTRVSDEVFNEIKQFYEPKCYNENQEYIKTDSLENFVCYGSPYCVLDVIEMFAKYNKDTDFEIKLNQILKLINISLKLTDGKMESKFISQIKYDIHIPVHEVGLKELLQEAANYYEEGNLKIAVEKLWDALERLKTYYSPTLDKKILLKE